MYSLKSFLKTQYHKNLGKMCRFPYSHFTLSNNDWVLTDVVFFRPPLKYLGSYRRYIGVARCPNLFYHSFYRYSIKSWVGNYI